MADDHLILVLGRRGCGKTFLARKLAHAWPPDRILVHDPMAEFPQYEVIPDDFDPETFTPGTLVIADEIDLVAPPPGYAAPWVRHVTHYGRHSGVSMIGCSRRPANIHRDISALATRVYLGRMTEPRDVDYCVKAWGTRCEGVSQLEAWQFIVLEP